MANPLSAAMFSQPAKPLLMAQVTITQVSPLLITFNGTPNVSPAPQWSGSTYALGVATAIYTNPGIPIVLPNA